MAKAKRQELLNNDLISYSPKQWRINIPFINYNFRMEDIVPALSGVIGKISLIAAFAWAWSSGLNITDPAFVTENVRLEIVLAGVLTILLSGILNPYAGPAGTLAPFIPLIPVIVVAGVHPLPLGILIGTIGIIIAAFGGFNRLLEINGPGTKGGITLLFGVLGIYSSLESLGTWAQSSNVPEMFVLLVTIGLGLYVCLIKLKLRWAIIPACAMVALVISFFFGAFPVFKTGMGFPIVNPSVWWNEKWGIGWGLNAQNFVKAFPFAMLAIVMWPVDALAIKTIQESNYPVEAKKAVFDMNSTYFFVSLRSIIGTILGGSQIAAIWRSFMIPLSIVRRPIGASAFILGLAGICFGLLGFPLDIAVFPPLVWLVLIFGIYVPLLEVGLDTIKGKGASQIAAICFVAGIAVNPVIGWSLSVIVENFKMIENSATSRVLSKKDLLLTAALVIGAVVTLLVTYTL